MQRLAVIGDVELESERRGWRGELRWEGEGKTRNNNNVIREHSTPHPPRSPRKWFSYDTYLAFLHRTKREKRFVFRWYGTSILKKKYQWILNKN